MMKRTTTLAILVSVGLFGIAGAGTFTVDIERTGVGGPVLPDGSFEFQIRGTMSEGDNDGLAFFSLDLQMAGVDVVNLGMAIEQDAPTGGVMENFKKDLGYSIDYEGTSIEDDLVQAGGGMNTIENDPNAEPFEPFPSGPVIEGVAHGGGEILLSGTLTFDNVAEGTYTLSLIPNSLFANMIVDFAELSVDPVDDVQIGDDLVIEVLECVSFPQIVHTETFQADPDIPQTRPCSGYIDPRLESQNGVTLSGLTEVFFLFSDEVFGDEGQGALSPANFVVSATGGAPVPTIDSVDKDPLSVGEPAHVRVTFAAPGNTALQEWITIEANVFNALGCPISDNGDAGNVPEPNEPDRIDIGMLPGDVDNSGDSSVLDVLRFRQYVIDDLFDPDCGTQLDTFDINRNGALNDPALDFLRLRQIFFGVNPATMNWTGVSMNSSRP